MRFKKWARVQPFVDTPRKRAAFERSKRAKQDKLPLFAAMIAAEQHDADTEMARRAKRWPELQQETRDRHAEKWREARRKIAAYGDNMRPAIRALWNDCPYPADPVYLLGMLHDIEVGRLDVDRPPWRFPHEIRPRTTPNPESFDAAFKQIGRAKVGGGPKTIPADRFTFIGNLGNGLLILTSTVRLIEPNESFYTPSNMRLRDSFVGRGGHFVDIEVNPGCIDADLAEIQRLAEEADTRPVVVRRAGRWKSQSEREGSPCDGLEEGERGFPPGP